MNDLVVRKSGLPPTKQNRDSNINTDTYMRTYAENKAKLNKAKLPKVVGLTPRG